MKLLFHRKTNPYLGFLGEKDLVEAMRGAHIYVMPSHIEISPNNLCEAMLFGMPCIKTLAGGSDSILVNKKDGLVIQDGDPWSIAGAIIELKNNWIQAVVYGQSAKHHAKQRHDKNTLVEKLLSAYQDIINQRKIKE